MSIQALSWVLENSESRLGPRHVMISIANHAKADGTGAWPSISTIARESRLSQREVQYAIQSLVEDGELEVEYNAGPRGTNLYSLLKMGSGTSGAKFAGVGGVYPSGAKSEKPLRVQNPVIPSGAKLDEKSVDFAPEPSEEKKKEPNTVREEEPSSAQAAQAAQAPSTTNFDFPSYVKMYSDFAGTRFLKSKKQLVLAEAEWGKLSHQDRQKVFSSLCEWTTSGKWDGENEKYRPGMANFISQDYWKNSAPQRNHRSECERILEIFLSVTGQNSNLHSLTDGRYEMLSKRWDDAIEKAENHDPANAMKVVEAAIQAYYDNHEGKKLKSLISPEKVFESTETFERWLGEACRED